MATQDIVSQLLGVVASNPQILSSLLEHPYSTVREVTGEQEVSRQTAAEVVTAMTGLASGQQVDFGNIGSIASSLLGQNNNSVHTMASNLLGGLFGGGASVPTAQPLTAAIQQPAATSNAAAGIPTSILSNLAGVVFSGGTANNKQAVDLSDGIGIDDVMGLISMFSK